MTTRRWTGADAHTLRDAMSLTIEEFASALDVAPRTVAYWSARPDTVPRNAIQGLLDRLHYQYVHTDGSRSAGAPSAIDPLAADTDRFIEEALRDARGIGADGLDLMGSAIEGIARTYTTRPLLDEFAAAAALQREANALLAHTARPGEVIELYLMIAEAGALMASCAFDLGQSDRAMQLASASLIYADRAGDPSVSAWLLGLQASLDLWTARPARALDSVERGLSIAAAGQPRFRLHHIGARAAAAASNHQLAADHLRSAEEEWGSARYDRLGDGVAGEFHFDRARADACAAATGLMLGDWDRVVSSAQQSIDHYGASPAAARVPMLGARLDLATAMVHRGDMSSAADHLETAFGEAAEHRYSLVVRVRRVADHLAPRRREVQASRLVDLTTDWLARTT